MLLSGCCPRVWVQQVSLRSTDALCDALIQRLLSILDRPVSIVLRAVSSGLFGQKKLKTGRFVNLCQPDAPAHPMIIGVLRLREFDKTRSKVAIEGCLG